MLRIISILSIFIMLSACYESDQRKTTYNNVILIDGFQKNMVKHNEYISKFEGLCLIDKILTKCGNINTLNLEMYDSNSYSTKIY